MSSKNNQSMEDFRQSQLLMQRSLFSHSIKKNKIHRNLFTLTCLLQPFMPFQECTFANWLKIWQSNNFSYASISSRNFLVFCWSIIRRLSVNLSYSAIFWNNCLFNHCLVLNLMLILVFWTYKILFPKFISLILEF